MPRIKLDIIADEVLADPPVINIISHDYSDRPVESIKVICYSYLETFAEKIRALKERTRPRDLYDVVNLYHKSKNTDISGKLYNLLKIKCEFKKISVPKLGELDLYKQDCESGWNKQLSHQLNDLPEFKKFWDELVDFFDWLER